MKQCFTKELIGAIVVTDCLVEEHQMHVMKMQNQGNHCIVDATKSPKILHKIFQEI